MWMFFCKKKKERKVENCYKVGLFGLEFLGPKQMLMMLENNDEKIKDTTAFDFETFSLQLSSKVEKMHFELFQMHRTAYFLGQFRSFKKLVEHIDVFWLFFTKTEDPEHQSCYYLGYPSGENGVLDLISRSWSRDKLVILECAGFSSEDTERWVELLKSKLRHLNETNFFIIETQPEYDVHCKNMNIKWYESKKKGLLWVRETLKMQNAEPPT